MIVRDVLMVILTLIAPSPHQGGAPVPDCAEISGQSPAEGICETVGVVDVSEDWAVKFLVLSNGKRGGITLHNHPNIQNGHEIYIKANYYARDGHLDLVDYIEMRSAEPAELD